MNITKEQTNKLKVAEVVIHGINKLTKPIIGGDCALFLQGLKEDFDSIDIIVKNPSKITIPYELVGVISSIDATTKYIYNVNDIKFVFYELDNINEIKPIIVNGLDVCPSNYILGARRIEKENMGIKEKMNIDDVIDLKLNILKDILEKTLNVKVVDYCHGKKYSNYVNFWIQCKDAYSMSILARAVNKNYLASENKWFASLSTNDEKTNPQFNVNIHMVEMPKDEESVIRDIDKIILNIKYWSDKKYYNYFGKIIESNNNDEKEEFKKALQKLINNFSIENDSNTPDYILADYIYDVLDALKQGINKRDNYYKPNPYQLYERKENYLRR